MNWKELFEANNIEYVSSGPNTKGGEISIRCPFCGEEDPSQHLGINQNTGTWACWRDVTHRGISPYRLISALLGVSQARARLIAASYSQANPDSFDVPVTPLGVPQGKIKPVKLLDDFIPIEPYSLTHKFWMYLWKRGFDEPNKVIEQYQLKACLTGRYRGRLIITIYDQNHNLIGWQGRALIQQPQAPRYLSNSEVVKKTIFNLQNLTEGEVLYVCEGPIDALKLDFYGAEYGQRATCTFGVTLTTEQLYLLSSLKNRFRRIVLMMDNDGPAMSASFGLSDWLGNIEFGSLPEGIKDPGQLSPTQARRLVNGYRRKSTPNH